MNFKKDLSESTLHTICESVKAMLEKNLYKCERPAIETACSVLLQLVQEVAPVKTWIFNNMLQILITFGNYVQTPDIKAVTIQILTAVLKTSQDP